MNKYNLLYIEDDTETIENILYFLKNRFKNIYIAHDGKEGLELYDSQKIDLILSDINVPFLSGLQVAEKIRKNNSIIPIILLTAYSERNKLLKAIDLQIDAYILKPLNIKELNNALLKITTKLNKQNKCQDIFFYKRIFTGILN